MTKTQALELREALSAAAQHFTDEQSERYSFLFPQWHEDVQYDIGFKCLYNGKLYRVIQPHVSTAYLTPEVTEGIMFEAMV